MGFAEDYIAAWNTLDEDTFVGQFAPDGRYTDATMALTYDGEAEIRRMFKSTMEYYQEPRFVFESGFSDDRHYASEWTSITVIDGTEYTTRVVSIGDLDENGKIIENRDYWNPQTVPNGAGTTSARRGRARSRSGP